MDFDLGKPFLEEVKYLTVKKTKKYGYVVLFITIRLYVLSSKFLSEKSVSLWNKLTHKLNHKKNGESVATETSNFLKMIADYKTTVKKIRRRIKDEEGI